MCQATRADMETGPLARHGLMVMLVRASIVPATASLLPAGVRRYLSGGGRRQSSSMVLIDPAMVFSSSGSVIG